MGLRNENNDEEARLLGNENSNAPSSSSSSSSAPKYRSIFGISQYDDVKIGDDSRSSIVNQGNTASSYHIKLGVLLALSVICIMAVLNNSYSGERVGVDEKVSSINRISQPMELSADGPWRTAKKFYIPTKCPGLTIMSGSADPRNIDLTRADISGLGPHGLETSIGAKVYRTGQANKHDVHWLVADTSEGDDYKLIKMVMVKVESVNNEVQLCTIAAGDFDIYGTDMELDEMTVKQAWASHTQSLVSECDTCPGYGVMNVEADWTTVDYEGDVNKYQSVGFISQSCPGDNYGHSDIIQNVTTELIDGYAGLAYLSGNDVRKGTGHEAVIFPNVEATMDNTISYIVGYVDFVDWTMKMVEIQLTDLNGQVHLCAPRAKTYANAPDLVNKSNIDYFWDSAEGINVAACPSCAGYGVSSFRFETSELVMPTPIPTAFPIAVPTALPSEEPRASPTAEPTELPENAYLVPDGKGTDQEVLDEVVDGTPDGKDTRRFYPVAEPTRMPIVEPSFAPIPGPTFFPVEQPTMEPSHDRVMHTMPPTIIIPTLEPTREPSAEPTKTPLVPPTFYPVGVPTVEPITEPTPSPTIEPTEKSDVILGRPCEKNDDYVDQGGVTVNGTAVNQNPEDEDIGTSEYLTMDPSPAPTLEPTLAPTELLEPGETAAPTLSPTFVPTVVDPTPEPTMGPVEVLDEPGETYHPSLAPTVVPTEASAAPTARVTFGDTLEPCVWEGDIYANDCADCGDTISDMLKPRKLLQTTGMKQCIERYGVGFMKTMKLVKKNTEIGDLERSGTPISASGVTNLSTNRPTHPGKPIATATVGGGAAAATTAKVAPQANPSVTTMSTAERRAFYLSHFTPEAKARIAKQKQDVAAAAAAAKSKTKTKPRPKHAAHAASTARGGVYRVTRKLR